jgi:hypothetical protein
MNIKINMLLKILFENNIYELHDNCLENKISSTKILKIPKSHQSKKARQNNGQKKKGQKDLEN